MIYFLLARILAFLLNLIAIASRSDHEKDLQILLLGQQLRILQREHTHPPRLSRLLKSEGITIIQTPYRAPKANAFAERWIGTVREECLDRLLIVSEGHLRRVLREYITYYNQTRPHQGIGQQCPLPAPCGLMEGPVRCRDVLGGIIHDYYRQAA